MPGSKQNNQNKTNWRSECLDMSSLNQIPSWYNAKPTKICRSLFFSLKVFILTLTRTYSYLAASKDFLATIYAVHSQVLSCHVCRFYLLKLLYPGHSAWGFVWGIRVISVSANAGSLIMACSQGERYDFGTAVLLNFSGGMSFKGPPYPGWVI